jgi:hypothetical protein
MIVIGCPSGKSLSRGSLLERRDREFPLRFLAGPLVDGGGMKLAPLIVDIIFSNYLRTRV